MDMQAILPSLSSAVSSTGAAVSKGGQAASQASNSSSGSFANLLQAEANPQSTDTNSVINSELLAAMSGLPQTIQQLLTGLEGNNEGEQSLISDMLEAMNRDPQMAQTLLNDTDVRSWLQDATSLLNAWAAQSSGFNSTLLNQQAFGNQSLTDQSNVLEMQRVLMTIATLNDQQPDHPILQHLLTQLKQVMEPYTAALTNQADVKSSGSELLAQTLTAASSNSVQQDRSIPKLAGGIVTGQANEDDLIATESLTSKIQVQPALSKLELLAVKNSHPYANLSSSDPLQPLPKEAQATDMTSNLNAGMPLQTVLRNPLSDMTQTVLPTMNAANFADDMSQFVVKTMKVSLLGDGLSEAKFALQPQNLGHIDVKLTMHNGTLVAQIATNSLGAKELIESQLPQLRQMLQNQGLQVERLEVTQNTNASSMMFQQQGQRQQSFNQEQSSKSRTSSDQLGIEDVELLHNIAEAKEKIRSASSDSSFQASV
ncbi:flagellar hook-length control protein FliK [Paenibacillus albiflavus]|uniref:Flagellar hook-length control protein FliK n=1 Tax=Paenibacillus albiflavus TaxID=2545760 RepID=A0A4R4EII5_9BACL|nr:flagellar hook-length control protein FliK [Paenibacillus albiflavus]TCZ79964.1 flagellar hook-length control protein FliK [Paenibacillus albiflavus]